MRVPPGTGLNFSVTRISGACASGPSSHFVSQTILRGRSIVANRALRRAVAFDASSRMTMRQPWPTTGSSSISTIVYSGADQIDFSVAASRNAAKTRSGVALNSWLRTSVVSGSWAMAACFILGFPSWAPGCGGNQVLLQGTELPLPEHAVLIHPGLCPPKGARVEPHAMSTPVARTPHEVRALEHLEVLRHGGPGHATRRGELSHGGRTARQAREDAAARGGRQRLERTEER